MTGPEYNPLDDEQPSREEWDAYEQSNQHTASMRMRIEHELAHSIRQRDHYARFINEGEDLEMKCHSKAFYNKHDLLIQCYRAWLLQGEKNVRITELETENIELRNRVEKSDAISVDRDHLRHILHMTDRIPRDGTEVIVHLQSNRYTYVKWDATMGLWEETCGDCAYPDSEIVRWSSLNWQPMPGMPGSEL